MIVMANGLPIYLTNMHGISVGNEVSFIVVKTILGVGRGFAQIPIQVALQASVPHTELGVATAVYLSSLGFGSNIGNRYDVYCINHKRGTKFFQHRRRNLEWDIAKQTERLPSWGFQVSCNSNLWFNSHSEEV